MAPRCTSFLPSLEIVNAYFFTELVDIPTEMKDFALPIAIFHEPVGRTKSGFPVV
jgi:hypothetical protein